MARYSGTLPRMRMTTRRNLMWAMLFASPWIIGFLVFTLGPMVASLYYSFTEFSVFQPPTWIGLENYRKLFLDDELFGLSLVNTLFMVVVAVPSVQAFALFTAMLLNLKVRGISVYRTIYFLPAIMPTVAVVILWMWIFNPQLGVVNLVLGALHLPQPGWIADPNWSKPVLIILAMWQSGTVAAIYIAALKNVPTQLYEAAQLDGAGLWGQFWHVTLPIISPVILFNSIVGIIWAFKYFTDAYVISQFSGGAGGTNIGAPQGSLLLYSVYLYANAFSYFKMGYASALAWILFLIVLAVTVFVLKFSSRWTYYD